MEDNLNLFCKRKTTSIYFLMEDNLNLFCKCKTTTLICFLNGRQPQFILLMENDLFFKIEDDFIFFENAINPQLICKWKTTYACLIKPQLSTAETWLA
jgi:hypothetical protein